MLNHQQSNLDSIPGPFQLPVNESKHRGMYARWRSGRHLSGDGRRWRASDGDCRTRKRRTDEEWPQRKNAVMVLKESIPQLQYTLVRATGPCHSPTYTVQTVINGQVRYIDWTGEIILIGQVRSLFRHLRSLLRQVRCPIHFLESLN